MQNEFDFSPASFISAGGEYPSPIFCKSFSTSQVKKAVLYVGCFGMYEGYINGEKISDVLYGTLNTDFHRRGAIDYNGVPFAEETEHRLYFSEYDVSELLKDGENTLSFLTGSGWYETQGDTSYGFVKLCFLLKITDLDGKQSLVFSDGDTERSESFITECSLLTGETHDYNRPSPLSLSRFKCEKAIVEKAPDTHYYLADCPPDRIIRHITPKLVSVCGEKRIYDVGEVISGFPVFTSLQGEKSEISVRLGELLDDNGALSDSHVYNQHMRFISDGEERKMYTRFTWFCFRYFEVTGSCTVNSCAVCHSDVNINSSFSADSEILNWYYNAFLRTQLYNMHGGVPSDCPHAERRGYTGDGQLVCNAAMSWLDAQSFYKKWIYDIADCQDSESGHVQYTAPFLPSGGGPGGWGSAIVNAPYEYYRHYRDVSVLSDLFPKMLKYLSYMEAHSENELVVSDRENAWCLGDWCTPEQTELNLFDGVKIPAPFVNTYFYIKSMMQVSEIAALLKHVKYLPKLSENIKLKKTALTEKYFDPKSGDFCENIQGANAFAVDIGLGNEKTVKNTAEHYKRLGRYDTGIFGTDIVTRVLFENGCADIALKLLTSRSSVSFYSEMKQGSATLWEYWNGTRSHCHPMFGAASAYLAEFVLGIFIPRNITDSRITIRPLVVESVKRASGYMNTYLGKISVSYDEEQATVRMPKNLSLSICIPNRKITVIKE